MYRHSRKIIDFRSGCKINNIIRRKRMLSNKERYLFMNNHMNSTMIKNSFQKITMRVVHRISDLEFILLFYLVSNNSPKRLEIGTHTKDKIQEIWSIVFGVFLLMLFQLFKTDTPHTCIYSRIKSFIHERSNSWLLPKFFSYKLKLVLAIKRTNYPSNSFNLKHYSDIRKLT